MSSSAVRLAALGACALLPLVAQAAAQIRAPAPKVAAKPAAEREIFLQADEVIYDDENKLVSVVGRVEISDSGRTLVADRVEYNQTTDTITARGKVSIMDARGNVAFADHVVLTDRMRDGALRGFGALIGKTGRLAARTARRTDNVVVANRAVYSPCTICQKEGNRTPLWQVKAERVVYDEPKHKVRFTNAVMEVGGVPVAWVPTMSVPDPTVRYASGLLTPEGGNSTKIGYFLRAPVYIALGQTQDLTLSPMVSTKGGQLLEAEYRARWNNGGLWLQGSGAHNPNGGLSGTTPGTQTYGHLFGSGRLNFNQNWRTGFDVQTASNNAYMRFYDISFLDRLVSDIFLEGTPGRSRFALTSYYFESLRSTDVQSRIPYILPKLEASFIPTSKVAGGSFRLDLNGVSIARRTGRNSQRLTAEADWKRPFVVGNGQIWTLVLNARGDGYRFENAAAGAIPASDYTINRGTAYAAIDWRWPFVAQGGGGRSYIISPIAQFIAQPHGSNPLGLRIEDSNDFEFDDNNVFSFNKVPGYDLIETGPRANVGVMAEALFPGGKVQTQLGQTYRLKPDPLFSAFSGNSGTSSDLVGSFSVKFPHLDITDRIDVDRGNGTVRRHEVYVTGTYARTSLQVSYVQLPASVTALGLPSREELNAQFDLNVWRNWQVFVAGQRDVQAAKFLNTEFGLGYEDECLAISLAYRRRYTQDVVLGVPPSTSVILRFALKTGDNAIEPFSLFPRDVFALTHP